MIIKVCKALLLFFVVFLELLEKQQLFVPQVLLFLAKVTQLLCAVG